MSLGRHCCYTYKIWSQDYRNPSYFGYTCAIAMQTSTAASQTGNNRDFCDGIIETHRLHINAGLMLLSVALTAVSQTGKTSILGNDSA